jgi:hypothetical protein
MNIDKFVLDYESFRQSSVPVNATLNLPGFLVLPQSIAEFRIQRVPSEFLREEKGVDPARLDEFDAVYTINGINQFVVILVEILHPYLIALVQLLP